MFRWWRKLASTSSTFTRHENPPGSLILVKIDPLFLKPNKMSNCICVYSCCFLQIRRALQGVRGYAQQGTCLLRRWSCPPTYSTGSPMSITPPKDFRGRPLGGRAAPARVALWRPRNLFLAVFTLFAHRMPCLGREGGKKARVWRVLAIFS